MVDGFNIDGVVTLGRFSAKGGSASGGHIQSFLAWQPAWGHGSFGDMSPGWLAVFDTFDFILIRIHLRQDAVLDLLLVPRGQDQGIVDLSESGEVLVFVDFLGEFRDDDFADDLGA